MKCIAGKDKKKRATLYEVDDCGLAGVTRLMIRSLRAIGTSGKKGSQSFLSKIQVIKCLNLCRESASIK